MKTEKNNASQEEIAAVFDGMKALVLEKNKRYGNSALAPVRVFSKLDPGEGICVRLDDKLSRINNSKELRKNDVADLMGYLTLLCIAKGWRNFSDLVD
ncbi:MAG: hypothetical protein SAMD01599839_07600 [Rectinema sp.]